MCTILDVKLLGVYISVDSIMVTSIRENSSEHYRAWKYLTFAFNNTLFNKRHSPADATISVTHITPKVVSQNSIWPSVPAYIVSQARQPVDSCPGKNQSYVNIEATWPSSQLTAPWKTSAPSHTDMQEQGQLLCSGYVGISSLFQKCTWVRSWNCSCLVTWFCYQMIAKPGNKTATPSWPDPYMENSINNVVAIRVINIVRFCMSFISPFITLFANLFSQILYPLF